MVDSKRPKLVGSFIRQRREALGLSQRALGLLFSPPVTTQFISNLERGVTPLPPNHVPTLTKSLLIEEAELMALLEREYTVKLSGRLGRAEQPPSPNGNGSHDPSASNEKAGDGHHPNLVISNGDYDFMRNLYDAYRQADKKTRTTFATVCESILNLNPPGKPEKTESQSGGESGS